MEFLRLLSGIFEYEAQAVTYLLPYVVNLVVVEHDPDLRAALACDVARTAMYRRPVCIVDSNVQAHPQGRSDIGAKQRFKLRHGRIIA
jgi:hypothetical protein